MRVLFIVGLVLLLVGCTDVSQPDLTVVGGGTGIDQVARIYQEYGRTTYCGVSSSTTDCKDESGTVPHKGNICGPPMKWSVQFLHDGDAYKYGVPYNDNLVAKLQQWGNATLKDNLYGWHGTNQVVRFYWVRFVDTKCTYTDNEVVLCAEPQTYSEKDSAQQGCIASLKTAMPGVQF